MNEVFGTDYERQIFSYSDGQKTVSADPMRLKGQLHLEAQRRGVSIDKSLEAIEKGDAETATDMERSLKWEAVLVLADLVATVFKVLPPYADEDGVDVTYAMSLLLHFLEYLEKKNPMLVWYPTSSQSTGSVPNSPSGDQSITPTSAA